MDSNDPEQAPASHPVSGPAPARAGDVHPHPVGCPYLSSTTGEWRASVARREHRCGALIPPASLAIDKQRRLCLTAGHAGCATFVAAAAAREARVGSGSMPDRSGRWGFARTPILIESEHGVRAAFDAVSADRRAWQLIPASLLLIAVVALGIGRLGGGTTASPAASPTGSFTAVASATAGPSSAMPTSGAPSMAPTAAPTVPPTPAITPTPSVGPTPAPTATPRTYRVQSGDTLYDIARKFGTTVNAIMKLNGLTSTTLHAGKVLLIP